MSNNPALIDQMRARTARFEKLRPSAEAFVDTRIPEHERRRPGSNWVRMGISCPRLAALLFQIKQLLFSWQRRVGLHERRVDDHSIANLICKLRGVWRS